MLFRNVNTCKVYSWSRYFPYKVLSATLSLENVLSVPVSQAVIMEKEASHNSKHSYVQYCSLSVSFIIILANRLPPLQLVFGLPVAFHEPGVSPAEDITSYNFVCV